MDADELHPFWQVRIANHRLMSGTLPRPGASPGTVLHFAGTFDGYVVRHDLSTWLPEEFVPSFEREGRLPELSLTMARTILFGFQRWHYFTDWDGSVPGEWVPCLRALMDRIRSLVLAREAGRRPAAGSRVGVEDGLMDAYEHVLEGYGRWGGYRAHGWTDFPDVCNFQGPMIWSEADCAFRLALELEREFPRAVHTEFAIGKATRLDYDASLEKRQRVDLVVSDLSDFAEDDTSQERFRTMRHDVFVETKWLAKGWRGGRFEGDAIKRVASVHADIAKLERHLELGRCRLAAVVVFDDKDYFATSPSPDGDDRVASGDGPVWQLVVGPAALRQRRLLSDP